MSKENEVVNANYLQVLGGHCFICHKDYKGNDHKSPECVEVAINSPDKIEYCGNT